MEIKQLIVVDPVPLLFYEGLCGEEATGTNCLTSAAFLAASEAHRHHEVNGFIHN